MFGGGFGWKDTLGTYCLLLSPVVALEEGWGGGDQGAGGLQLKILSRGSGVKYFLRYNVSCL